jgi:glycosyltransferase involved in cell wall biosynthesis
VNVALISTDYLPNAGGIAAHVAGLAGGLAATGCAVAVAVPTFTRWPHKVGVITEGATGVPVIRSKVWIPPMAGRLPGARSQVRRLREKPLIAGADVVHWHTPGWDADIAGRLPARLRVFTNHTSHFVDWTLGGTDPARARRALRWADTVICTSQILVEATVSAGFPPDRVHFIANGVDVERFRPGLDRAIREQLGIGADDVIFLCPSRLEKVKGVPYWLAAITKLVNTLDGGVPVRFLLVGDYEGADADSDREVVRSMLATMPQRELVTWVGHVDPQRMPEYYAAADVVVLPSLMEATSIAGLEAMAAGKPLIGSCVGGIPQIITHGTCGLLVEAAQPDSLAAAMRMLALEPEVRARMGAKARERTVREFSWSRAARQTLSVYEDALARAHGLLSAHEPRLDA